MNKFNRRRPLRVRCGALALMALALAGLPACSVLKQSATPPSAFYVLDGAGSPGTSAPAVMAAASAPILIVNPPHAAAGFDSSRIIYIRQDHQLDYYARSEWVDPPARMLAPLLAAALGAGGGFRAVVQAPGSASGDYRLDTEIVRLQHEFQTLPSRVRFTLRATLVEDKSRRVVGWREFDASVAATADDPYGGVVAANAAVQAVLKDLAAFCTDAVRLAPIPK